jgi:MFS family permease
VDEERVDEGRGDGDLTRPVPVREFPPLPAVAPRVRTVNVGAVLGGLVLLAVAAWVGAHEVTGATWDWRWSAAGVLLASGACVVVAAVVSAVRQRDRGGDQR